MAYSASSSLQSLLQDIVSHNTYSWLTQVQKELQALIGFHLRVILVQWTEKYAYLI